MTAPASDAEVIAFLARKWGDEQWDEDANDWGPFHLDWFYVDGVLGGPVGWRLFDGEYSFGPVPAPIIARLGELGYNLPEARRD